MTEPKNLPVHALLLAERLESRALERRGPVLPGVLSLGELPGGGRGFAFRWGAVVTIGASLDQTKALAAELRPHLQGPFDTPVHEVADIIIGAAEDGADEAGRILLRDASPARLALVAKALAKSAVLTEQEATLARTLDRLEAPLERLRRGRLGMPTRLIVPLIGEAIAARAIIRAGGYRGQARSALGSSGIGAVACGAGHRMGIGRTHGSAGRQA